MRKSYNKIHIIRCEIGMDQHDEVDLNTMG